MELSSSVASLQSVSSIETNVGSTSSNSVSGHGSGNGNGSSSSRNGSLSLRDREVQGKLLTIHLEKLEPDIWNCLIDAPLPLEAYTTVTSGQAPWSSSTGSGPTSDPSGDEKYGMDPTSLALKARSILSSSSDSSIATIIRTGIGIGSEPGVGSGVGVGTEHEAFEYVLRSWEGSGGKNPIAVIELVKRFIDLDTVLEDLEVLERRGGQGKGKGKEEVEVEVKVGLGLESGDGEDPVPSSVEEEQVSDDEKTTTPESYLIRLGLRPGLSLLFYDLAVLYLYDPDPSLPSLPTPPSLLSRTSNNSSVGLSESGRLRMAGRYLKRGREIEFGVVRGNEGEDGDRVEWRERREMVLDELRDEGVVEVDWEDPILFPPRKDVSSPTASRTSSKSRSTVESSRSTGSGGRDGRRRRKRKGRAMARNNAGEKGSGFGFGYGLGTTGLVVGTGILGVGVYVWWRYAYSGRER